MWTLPSPRNGTSTPERIRACFQIGDVGRGEFGVNALVGAPDVALAVEHLVEGLGVRAHGVVTTEDAVVPFGRLGVTA